MKKQFLTTVILLSVFIFKGFSQSLINENFESWIDNSAFIDPEGWVTFNDLSPEYGIPFTVLKTTDANEGQYAALMQTYTFLDGANNKDTLPSIMVYSTDVSSGIHYPWTKRLKNISFKYKYKPNGIDTGYMYLVVGYRDKKTNRMIDQGGAFYMFAKREDTYTKVSIPLYFSTNHVCDTFILAFINSAEKAGGNRCKPGTILMLDDIDTEWEDFPAVLNIKAPDTDFGVYPNPASDMIYVKGLEDKDYKVLVIDMTGRTVLQRTGVHNGVNVADLNPGFYHLTISSPDGSYSGSQYFIKK